MSIDQNFLVELSHSTVALLIAQRQYDTETIDKIIQRHLIFADSYERQNKSLPRATHKSASQQKLSAKSEVYEGEVLGKPIRSETLPSFFAAVVDTIHDVAPEAVAQLAQMRARTRAYVARTRTEVHAGRIDLPTKMTSSGWYISENIGRKDLVRALEALCQAANLSYGRDIRFCHDT